MIEIYLRARARNRGRYKSGYMILFGVDINRGGY